jgi:Tfp pilus assembly protein PilX
MDSTMHQTRGTHADRNGRTATCNTPESGQALVLALLALALAVLLVTGFLYFASTSQRATVAAEDQTADRYSADAGVEHAIWRLENEPGFPSAGGEAYSISINGQTVLISVTQVLTP